MTVTTTEEGNHFYFSPQTGSVVPKNKLKVFGIFSEQERAATVAGPPPTASTDRVLSGKFFHTQQMWECGGTTEEALKMVRVPAQWQPLIHSNQEQVLNLQQLLCPLHHIWSEVSQNLEEAVGATKQDAPTWQEMPSYKQENIFFKSKSVSDREITWFITWR